MNKSDRHNKILEIINSRNVYRQDELKEILEREGIFVTQATLSRDMKELGIRKISDKTGNQKYAAADKAIPEMPLIVRESVISTDHSGSIVVFRCHIGTAQAVCAAIDRLNFFDSLGTIAGDDTIFMLMRSEKSAEKLSRDFNKLL